MKNPRYNMIKKWFKGNVHIHSKASDGGKSFPEIAELYAGLGYDFLYRTDHWIASDVEADMNHYPLLWLDGIEVHGKDQFDSFYHILCLGTLVGISDKMSIETILEIAREQNALVILAHPYWSGNHFDDIFRYKFDGVEKYNHVTGWLNGKSDSSVYWDCMLHYNSNTLSFAVDDAHVTNDIPCYNGGWIHVNCQQLTRNEIQSAIRSGQFYSTCGPEIEDITYDNNTVSIKTSPVKFIRLVGPAWNGKRYTNNDNRTIDYAEFEVPDEWDYVYIEIEDHQSRRAWTNTLFTIQ